MYKKKTKKNRQTVENATFTIFESNSKKANVILIQSIEKTKTFLHKRI